MPDIPDLPYIARDRRKLGWFRIDNEIITEHLREMGRPAFIIYSVLAMHANNDTAISYPGFNTLHDLTGMSKTTISAAILTLEARGLIHVQRSTKGKRGRASNIYTLLEIPQVSTPTVQGKYTDCTNSCTPTVQELDSVNDTQTRQRGASAESSNTPKPETITADELASVADPVQAQNMPPKFDRRTQAGRDAAMDWHNEQRRARLTDKPWLLWLQHSKTVQAYPRRSGEDFDLMLYVCWTLNKPVEENGFSVHLNAAKSGTVRFWLDSAANLCKQARWDKAIIDKTFAYLRSNPQVPIKSPESCVFAAGTVIRSGHYGKQNTHQYKPLTQDEIANMPKASDLYGFGGRFQEETDASKRDSE